MKRRFFLITLFLHLISSALSAQSFYFERRFDIPVNDSSGNFMKEPWFGGLNAVIMGEIDLNFDGRNDLVVYDQHAEKIFTFLNMGVGKNGLNDYRYAPEFEANFPKFPPNQNRLMWFQLVDFNGDSLPDLFMSDGLGRVAVYKNVSSDSTVKFELYIPRLREQLPNMLHMDLMFSPLAFPHFIDLDGDGDLDLLVFGGMGGTTLFYYKNRSVENFGRIDTFDFSLADDMWGCFREGSASNEIVLNTCDKKMEYNVPRAPYHAPKHGEGSTIFAIDLNNDGLFDLLLADGGYPGITALFNGGSPNEARIIHLDTTFPRQSTPVNLFNTPAVSAIDIDNCGVKELIFSPFNARPFSTESYASIWVYKNMSPSGDANFQLLSKHFLQEDMLDFGMGSFPTVVDIDGNGLWDIVVGNYGRIDSAWEVGGVWETRFVADLTLLRNIGTKTEPKFQVYPLNLTPPLRVAGAVPTFGDIDNDGHLDLLIGTECGKILHYRNQNPPNDFPPDFVLVNPNILQENIGTFLAPQLFDLNGDGFLDLVVGNRRTFWRDANDSQYFKGNIYYFQNAGAPKNPKFTLITDSLGRVDVINRERSNFGYSKPHFFRDTSGNTHLFCGNEDGKILHYTDIDGNLHGTFRRLDDVRFLLNDRVQPLCEGMFTAVAVADFNNDGILDMVVGNHRGGLTIFFGISEFPYTNIDRPVETHNYASLQIYPNPVQDLLFIQSDETERMQGHILDLQGRVVRSLRHIQNDEGIDVSGLPAGIYVLSITVRNQVFTQKFIKN